MPAASLPVFSPCPRNCTVRRVLNLARTTCTICRYWITNGAVHCHWVRAELRLLPPLFPWRHHTTTSLGPSENAAPAPAADTLPSDHNL